MKRTRQATRESQIVERDRKVPLNERKAKAIQLYEQHGQEWSKHQLYTEAGLSAECFDRYCLLR